ncbi:hypothetical protein BKA58DRAFT_277670, partial [Alternaria rosae]|uniref:uncharacterized protein n=1 Tax=Alternaria rosae TaxID=1187941 RepID=UPI001E8EC71A
LPQRDATKARYRSFLNRFLCYVFRSWQVCQKLNQSLSEVYGLQLSDAQADIIESVWSDLSTKGLSKAEPAFSSRISETVFELLVLFWTDVSTDGILKGKAIVHFSGVLGIHPYELAYRTTSDYTPYLSALLWIGRLIILECALPLRGKKHLPGIVQPFDPHTPRDRDGILRLLSFQTGHNPATHASAYALDRAYPAKLQPKLVEQYLEVSKVLH